MKTLKLSISLLLVICNFISITATAQKQTVIKLDSIPSNRVIKDLEKGDLCKQKLNITLERIEIKDRTINTLESKVNLLEVGVVNLNLAIVEKDKGIGFQSEIITNSEKQVKRAKRNAGFWKLTSIALAGLLGYQFIK